MNNESHIECTPDMVAFSYLRGFATFLDRNFQSSPSHIKLIADALEQVENDQIKRLIITLPPRHGKSMLVSEYFPAWFLGRNPSKSIIFASYGQEFATGFGRKVRNHMSSDLYHQVFPNTLLSDDSTAANRFHTTKGGVYYAVGAGASITGRGAHILLIDDPLKSREEAESALIRQKIKDWFSSTAYTRLEPDGAIVIVQCMVGDTNVLMADGSNKKLKDICPNDLIATFDDGEIKTSKVLNWRNQGHDCVYAIKMKSGIVVRANKRHPFLVQNNGKLEWIRLKNLKKNDIILRVIGESGKVLNVPTRDVSKMHTAKDSVPHTITSFDGQQGTIEDRQKKTELLILNTDMESHSTNTMQSILNNKGDVLSAKNCQGKMLECIGGENSASTTVTIQTKLEDCSAMIAISQLDTEKHQKYLSKQLNTYQIIPDHIEEIYPDGYEEVFDIQVEATENFIANGLISHNTRWHNDDLVGWLLTEKKEDWKVINLPAISIDEEGNEVALWPERFSLKRLKEIRNTINSRDWAALYMQTPVVVGQEVFKPSDMQFYDKNPYLADMNIYVIIDPANSKNKTSDNTAIIIVGLNKDGNWYVLDAYKDKLNLKEREDLLFEIHQSYNPKMIYYEKYGMQIDIDFMKRAMEYRNYRFPISEVGGSMAKTDRIMRLQPLLNDKKIYFPRFIYKKNYLGEQEELIQYLMNEEMIPFPFGKHDDLLDALSRIVDIKVQYPNKNTINYYQLYSDK